jgi:hypothetical protein
MSWEHFTQTALSADVARRWHQLGVAAMGI